MKDQIVSLIKKVISEKHDIVLESINLETPPKKELGDYAFGCFVLAKDLKQSPALIAEQLSQEFISNEIFQEVTSAGPYINFKLDNSVYTKLFKKLISEGEIVKKNTTIVIDYIGANVGKPLHIGHMCTPNQGQVLVNLYKRLGYDVIADSHIGDWGIIFGKLILAYKLWGNEAALKDDAVEHLLSLYIKATSEAEEDETLDTQYREAFKLLSQGDAELISLWERFTSYSIASMLIQLKRLNIEYDYDIGESFYAGLNLPKMGDYPDLEHNTYDIVKELIEKKIATRNEDNSVGVVFPDEAKLSSCILEKRDGTHGYFASDLASIKYRCENWNPEKIIYCTDSRQQLHFRQAFYIGEKANWLGNTQLFHAFNGFISLKDGAMSTRSGKIIRLGDLLDESEKRARELILTKRDDLSELELAQLAKTIGIGAIKYGYLKKSRETDIVFDWDEFMTFEGNSGPYIQYAYVRANNIIQKSESNNSSAYSSQVNFSQSEEIELVKTLLEYEEILNKTAEKNMPHILCGYAYDLTKKFSSFYNSVHILNEENEDLKILRLSLVKTFKETLGETLGILGIEAPEKM